MNKIFKLLTMSICAISLIGSTNTPHGSRENKETSIANSTKSDDGPNAAIDAWQKIKIALSAIEAADLREIEQNNYLSKMIFLKSHDYINENSSIQSIINIKYKKYFAKLEISTYNSLEERKLSLSISLDGYVEYSPNGEHERHDSKLCINYDAVRDDLKNMGWSDGVRQRGNEGIILPILISTKKGELIYGDIKFISKNGSDNNMCFWSASLTRELR